MELRIGHLEHLRDTRATSTFDLCDDVTSGMMARACAYIDERLAELKRRTEVEASSRDWSSPVKEAFQSLQKAEREFEDVRAENEVNPFGTLRGAHYNRELDRLRDQFLTNLKRFAKGDIPTASEADLQAMDRKLNVVYRRLVGVPQSQWQFGKILPPGIRTTERIWIKLRDAWIEFAGLAYPELSSTRIANKITRWRLDQLQSLVRNGE